MLMHLDLDYKVACSNKIEEDRHFFRRLSPSNSLTPKIFLAHLSLPPEPKAQR